MLPSTLTLYPIPSENMTATVYYFPRIAYDLYTPTIGASTFPLEDEFIQPVIYITIANLLETEGDEKRAIYYRQLGEKLLNDLQANFPRNDGTSEAKYSNT